MTAASRGDRPIVSRETSSAPEAPPEAAVLLGTAAPTLAPLAALLAGPGVDRGLLGPRELPLLWHRHLLNCAVAVEGVPPGSAVVDVGSGAGLPGLVWALLRPDLAVTLVEPLLRRSDFLAEAVAALGLAPRVLVRRARAGDLHGEVTADVVTARAVAPLHRLVALCLPLLAAGGELRALKGRRAQDEVDVAGPALLRAGARQVWVSAYGVGVLTPPTMVVHVSLADRVAAATPPRRGGAP